MGKSRNGIYQCCQNCFFSVNEENFVRTCHFNAPTWVSGTGTGFEEKLFPVVKDDEWCGEWRHNSDEKRKEN